VSVADYYEILGVSRDATQDEIKRTFRRKARDTHPDANPDDPMAEQRFREIAQAYEILSDPQRRAAYDRGGQFDIGDLFSSFAGMDDLLARFFGGGRPGPAAGSDVLVSVEVSLAEAASGASRRLEYRAAAACAECDGGGSAPGSAPEVCDRCGGQGSLRVTRQTFLGAAMSIVPCDRCRGRGRVITDPCPECRGAGSVVSDLSVTVEVPPGIEHGSRLRVPRRGAAGESGAPSGDLYVEVQVTPDERFERHGSDLIHRTHIGPAEAALGTTISVPTVDGDPVDLEVAAGTQPGSVFKMSRRGMPRLHRRGRGDLLIEVRVAIPTRLSTEQEDALRAYAAAARENPVPPPRRHRSR